MVRRKRYYATPTFFSVFRLKNIEPRGYAWWVCGKWPPGSETKAAERWVGVWILCHWMSQKEVSALIGMTAPRVRGLKLRAERREFPPNRITHEAWKRWSRGTRSMVKSAGRVPHT